MRNNVTMTIDDAARRNLYKRPEANFTERAKNQLERAKKHQETATVKFSNFVIKKYKIILVTIR